MSGSFGSASTSLYEYDEEQHLVRIKKDFGGGNIQTAYEYGHAYDGGRRWRKDIAANIWTWYPCGVACCAGDLVEKTSDLTGGTWTTSALYLKGLSIVRRNSEYHHFDLNGVAGVVTGGGGAVLSNNLFDTFGTQRLATGSAASPWRWAQAEDEGLVFTSDYDYLPGRALPLQQKQKRDCKAELDHCQKIADGWLKACLAIVAAAAAACYVLCVALCKGVPFCMKVCVAGCTAAATAGAVLCYNNFRDQMKWCMDQYYECLRQQSGGGK